ncbi:YmfQ family protein [Janthinobacterium sp. PSPC2-1]|uniref:YmfQ family protein n=1 Tax=unclassified Janthinobacterium TaxID=2610881 RepID=UPI003CF7D91C
MQALSKRDFVSILQKLLPTGAAWPRSPGASITRLLAALAHMAATFDLRLQLLLDELNPDTSFQLLPEWEAFTGACGSCCIEPGSMKDRRARVISKLTEQGSLSKAYFLQLAADLGYQDTTITEFRPTHCEMTCEVPVVNEAWRFVWMVNLPHEENNYSMFRANSPADSLIDAYDFGALECRFMQLKPAHTNVIFTYEGIV